MNNKTTAKTAIDLILRKRAYIAGYSSKDRGPFSSRFKHIEVITNELPHLSTATIVHEEDTLFVIYDWDPKLLSGDTDGSTMGFNQQIRWEHESLTLAVGEALGEYLVELGVGQSMAYSPPKVVYTGHGYGGALALMQSFVTPPAELITFGQPPVGGSQCSDYLQYHCNL